MLSKINAMKRLLKFRAWDGEQIRYDVTGFEHGKSNEMAGIFLNGDYHAISETPVMQFTGLLDRNGKEIYEGDIVELKRKAGWGTNAGDIEVVKWDSRKCRYTIGHSDLTGNKYLIVIGNIHENPEFLTNQYENAEK